MVSKKDRRHSGYVTPRLTISKKDLIKYDPFINSFYDDWMNHRDGLRDRISDFKKIKKIHHKKSRFFNEEMIEKRIKMNLKQNKLLKRRKAKQCRDNY